jgi:non-specific serine/threonine protein kinase
VRLARGTGRARAIRALALLVFLPAVLVTDNGDGQVGMGWQPHALLPLARAEVAAAAAGGELVVVGGFLVDGATSARVDAYSPGRNRWRRLPDLPVAVNHPMAASDGLHVYVVGGYAGAMDAGTAVREAWVFEGNRWRTLPRPPERRAAGGAAIVERRLYVVGGVGPNGLARKTLVLDLDTRRWSTAPGPTPREHLAVVGARGRVYALGGRRAGIDTNLAAFESFAPGGRRWLALPPVPQPRGGTGAAAVRGSIVSVGGEEPAGTIAGVYAYDIAARRWAGLADLPTARHGLGVVALAGRVYAVAGGQQPGLFVSGVNESIAP